MNNWFKTMIMFAGITALFMVVGYAIGGLHAMIISLAIGFAMNFFMYWFSDKMVLSMYGAKAIDSDSNPLIYNMVSELSQKAELPMPKVYYIEEMQPNAFATGRNPENAAVAVTKGLVDLLSPNEIRGVIAHELAHIKHRDILISTLSAIVAGSISSLANIAMLFGSKDEEGNNTNPIATIAVMILAPIAAMMIQMAISRAREYEADRLGAQIANDPNSLANALLKIESYAKGIPMSTAEAHPATAQMMIMNPLCGGKIDDLFSTHPTTEKRVRKLREMLV